MAGPGAARSGGLTGVALDLHAYRGLNVLARLRAGEADFAVTTEGDGDANLAVEPVGREAMVLVPPNGILPGVRPLPVCTIEVASLTGACLEGQLRERAADLMVVRRIESFAAAPGLALRALGC